MRGLTLVPILLVVLTLPGWAGCAPYGTSAEETRSVVDAYLAAQQARDLDRMMDLFADDASISTSQGGTWTGRDEIRAVLTNRVRSSFDVTTQRVEGTRGVWTQRVTRRVAGTPSTTAHEQAQATIERGKIARMLIEVGDAPSTQPTALAVSGPLETATGSGVLFIAGLWLWTLRRERPLGSTAHGQMIQGLAAYVERRRTPGRSEHLA